MIAVIGGAGYIGSHTVKYLIQHGNDVVVFDNLSTSHKEFIPSNVPLVINELYLKHYFVST
ncbi:NAD-dependent epimerase/dehydratase family protein [Lysinibacillus sphaericus]|uniref:NAD-dependent epimerase/dehydratase family protein n=1 Tax=Lysinibacillus sphaericus TaxID=1421 RepID=UPI003F7A15B9